MSGALHLLNCCSLRYTSKGPVVFAIFLLWPRDSALHLSSPIPSPGTQVRLQTHHTHTESPSGGGLWAGEGPSWVYLGAVGSLQHPRLFPRRWLTWNVAQELPAQAQIPLWNILNLLWQGRGANTQIQPRCSALLVANVTLTQMAQCPLP